MNKRSIVHVNNFCILGGIESLVIDFARTFPQYQHTLVTIQSGCEDLNFAAHLRDQGIRYMNADGKITKAMINELDPAIVMLHNTRGEHLEGEWPFAWLGEGRKVIGVHHARTWPLVAADQDWFVSDYVRKPYAKCEARMNAFTMPPCVWDAPYADMERPSRIPVVGRIQSGTNLRKGKVPPQFFDLLDQVQECEFFVVTSNTLANDNKNRERYRFAPIKPGAMAGYLKEIDIFAIWGDTTETWSRVVTEANLSGIPVVARNHNDGLAEQLRKSNGGMLVDTEEEFVETLNVMVEDKILRRTHGLLGKEWCLKNASTAVLQDRFMETFLDWSLD